MDYQFFAKAPYEDIFYMPYKYLLDCQERFGELQMQMFKTLASIFMPVKGDDDLNVKLSNLVKNRK